MTTQRVFVRVIGFSDVERHAINTVFRLSDDRPIAFSLWDATAPEPPGLLLADGAAYEAQLEAESFGTSDLQLLWVGEPAPAHAARSFQRPLDWSQVLEAMDNLVGATEPETFDIFDLPAADPPDTQPPEDAGFADTQPPATEPEAMPQMRVLVASADLEERLYLRARLALAGLFLVDDALDAAATRRMLREHSYQTVLVSLNLPGGGWAFVRELKLAAGERRLIVLPGPARWLDRFNAWRCGVPLLPGPPQPDRLQELLGRA